MRQPTRSVSVGSWIAANSRTSSRLGVGMAAHENAIASGRAKRKRPSELLPRAAWLSTTLLVQSIQLEAVNHSERVERAIELALLIAKARREVGLRVFRRSRGRRRRRGRSRGRSHLGRRSRHRSHRLRRRSTTTDRTRAARFAAVAVDHVVTALLQSLLRVLADATIAVRQRTGQGRHDFAAAAAGVLLQRVTNRFSRLTTNVLVGVIQTVDHRAQDFRIALAVIRAQLVDGVSALLAVAGRLRLVDQVSNFAGVGAANLGRGARRLVANALAVMEDVEQAVRVAVAGVAAIARVAGRSGRHAAAGRSRSTVLRRTSRRSTARGRSRAAVRRRSGATTARRSRAALRRFAAPRSGTRSRAAACGRSGAAARSSGTRSRSAASRSSGRTRAAAGSRSARRRSTASRSGGRSRAAVRSRGTRSRGTASGRSRSTALGSLAATAAAGRFLTSTLPLVAVHRRATGLDDYRLAAAGLTGARAPTALRTAIMVPAVEQVEHVGLCGSGQAEGGDHGA